MRNTWRRKRMMMARSGFTLLEMLIVIALLIALAALALPAVVTTLQQRSFQAVVDISVQQLLIARAHAQSSGRPVEVMYRPDPPRVEARFFDVRLSSPVFDAFGEVPLESATGLTMMFDEESEETGVIPEGWAWRNLPHSVRITSTIPAVVLDATEVLPADLPEELVISDAAGSGTSGAPLRLAVFLPDGSALLGRGAWLSDGDGRAVRLSVNEWTGLPQTERLEEILAALAAREEEELPSDEVEPRAE